MRTSDAIDALAGALAKAQGAMKPATKDAKNLHFKSTYADLASVIEAMRGALSANCISYVQGMDNDRGVMVTRLSHASGQWIESDTPIYLGDKATMQQLGSALTYARRYALMAMVGIAADDDDGNAAAEAPAQRQQVQSPPPFDTLIAAKRLRASISLEELSGTWKDAAFQAGVNTLPELERERLINIKDEVKAALHAAFASPPREVA